MKKINLILLVSVMGAMMLLLYSCSKENIDETEDIWENFDPTLVDVLQMDSGVWDVQWDTSRILLDSCFLGIIDSTFLPGGGYYVWTIAAANSRAMYPFYYVNFTSSAIEPGIYQANWFSTRDFNGSDILERIWEPNQIDLEVEIFEVGEVGEGVSGTIKGKLINDSGSEIPISSGFNNLYRYQ